MEACALRHVDEELYAHRQAFLNFKVQATDSKGRPVYKRFDKFYDYDKAIAEAKEKKPSDSKFSRYRDYYRKGINNG